MVFPSSNDQANLFSRDILEPNRIISVSFTSFLNIQSTFSPIAYFGLVLKTRESGGYQTQK